MIFVPRSRGMKIVAVGIGGMEIVAFFYFDMKSNFEKEEEETMKVTIVVHPQGLPPKEAGKAWYCKPHIIN